jgi:hypothetical protein
LFVSLISLAAYRSEHYSLVSSAYYISLDVLAALLLKLLLIGALCDGMYLDLFHVSGAEIQLCRSVLVLTWQYLEL